MRYAGQNYELPVAWPAGPLGPARRAELIEGFERAHEQMYGYIAAEEPIQAVTFRLEAIGTVRGARDPRASSERDGVGERDGSVADRIARRLAARGGQARGGRRLRSRAPRARPSALRPGHRRADGRDHAAPARPDGARSIPISIWTWRHDDDGTRARCAAGCRSDHGGGDRQCARLHRRGDGRDAGARRLLDQREGAARLLDLLSSTRAAARCARPMHIPMHLGSLMGVVEHVTARHPLAEIRPGDVFIGNDAYDGRRHAPAGHRDGRAGLPRRRR